MKITKVEEQGLRLAMALARRGRQSTLAELAREERLGEALVAKVLGRLRRGGVVHAIRGRNGGYALAIPPEQLTVSRTLEALGLPLLQGCFNAADGCAVSRCPHHGDCGVRPVWRRLEDQIADMFGRMTLADLLDAERTVNHKVSSLWPRSRREERRSALETWE